MLDTQRSADAAILLFFRIVNMQQEAWVRRAPRKNDEKPPLLRVSLWPGQVALEAALTCGGYPETNPRSYARVCSFQQRFRAKQTPDHMQYSAARLQLCHPRNPQAGPAIAYLRAHFGDEPEQRKHRLPSKEVDRRSMERVFRLAHAAAKLAGLAEDTRWLEEAMRDIFGSVEREQKLPLITRKTIQGEPHRW